MNLLLIIETLRRNLKAVVRGGYVVLALVVVADIVRLLTAHHEVAAAAPAGKHVVEHATGFWYSLYHIAENVPVFWTAFGFLGCLLLVIVSKAGAAPVVSQHEDFYDE